MAGEKQARLQQAQLVDIHGSQFYDLLYEHEGEAGQLRRARLGREDVYANPAAGDAISVSYLMGVATRVEQRG